MSGERWQQTRGFILATPARRLPLFLGRALPVILNGALGLVALEALVGAAYAVAGYSLLRFVEWQSRRLATLERA